MGRKKSEKSIINNSSEVLNNASFTLGASNLFNIGYKAEISSANNIENTAKLMEVSNKPVLLASLYATHGLIKRIIDVPIQNAFRGNVKFRIDNLADDELKRLMNDYKKNVYLPFTQTCSWARLFGGGGVVIDTKNGNWEEELTEAEIEKGFKLLHADLWELNGVKKDGSLVGDMNMPVANDGNMSYFYNGVRLHKSRVIICQNTPVPFYARPMYRGWGASEVERIVIPYNIYTKTRKAMYELIDEAKISVLQIPAEIIAQANMSPEGAKLKMIIQDIAEAKNYKNVMVLTTEQDFKQVQPNFSWVQNAEETLRSDFAASCGFPKNKLYGEGATGFSSGQDAIENYNIMVEGVRGQFSPVLEDVIKLRCQYLFGFVPEEVDIEYPSLRVETSEQEEAKKDRIFNRVMQAFNQGLIAGEEALNQINLANLLPMEVKDKPSEDLPKAPAKPNQDDNE